MRAAKLLCQTHSCLYQAHSSVGLQLVLPRRVHYPTILCPQAGFGSLVQRRKSFNVKFHKDDHHAWGLRKHKLKAMTFDPSLMRE